MDTKGQFFALEGVDVAYRSRRWTQFSQPVILHSSLTPISLRRRGFLSRQRKVSGGRMFMHKCFQLMTVKLRETQSLNVAYRTVMMMLHGSPPPTTCGQD